MAPTLGYWQIRGLAHAIRLMLHYKEVEFEDKMYTQGDAPDFSREEWMKEKFTLGLDWPNLPYYIDGETKLTETSAIISYLGRKHNLCGSTEEARIRNDMTYSVSMANRNDCVRIFYNPKFDELVKPFLETLQDRLSKFSTWLGDNDYFGGSELVYSDFCMYDLLDIWRNLETGCLDKHEKLTAFMARIEALPGIKAYIESEGYMKKGPFNGAIAHWGGKALA